MAQVLNQRTERKRKRDEYNEECVSFHKEIDDASSDVSDVSSSSTSDGDEGSFQRQTPPPDDGASSSESEEKYEEKTFDIPRMMAKERIVRQIQLNDWFREQLRPDDGASSSESEEKYEETTFDIPRMMANERIERGNIAPNTIHQIWLQGEEHLKENRPHFWEHIQKFARLHPDRHHLWSEMEIVSLIRSEYPDLLDTFVSYPHFILRVDLAKYVILHHYGGFYVDADTHCLKPLDELIEICSEFGDRPLVCNLQHDPRAQMYSVVSWKRQFINNHFFYFAEPHHPFCKLLLEQAPLTAKKKSMEPFSLYVLRAIGPGFVMECCSIYKRKMQEENEGIQIRTACLLTIIDSDVLDQFWTHQSASTWMEHKTGHKVLQWFRSDVSKQTETE